TTLPAMTGPATIWLGRVVVKRSAKFDRVSEVSCVPLAKNALPPENAGAPVKAPTAAPVLFLRMWWPVSEKNNDEVRYEVPPPPPVQPSLSFQRTAPVSEMWVCEQPPLA